MTSSQPGREREGSRNEGVDGWVPDPKETWLVTFWVISRVLLMRRDFCAPYSGRGPREWESSGDLELEGKKPKQQESGWWELEAPGTRLQAKAGCPPETSTLTLALCLEERGLLLLGLLWGRVDWEDLGLDRPKYALSQVGFLGRCFSHEISPQVCFSWNIFKQHRDIV